MTSEGKVNGIWSAVAGVGALLLGALGVGLWKRGLVKSAKQAGAQAQHGRQQQAAIDTRDHLTTEDAKIDTATDARVGEIRERTSARLKEDPAGADVEAALNRWGE